MVTPNNIWSRDFLEDNPAYAYGAYRPNRLSDYAGAPKTFFDYYQNRQPQLEQEFVAAQGSLARAGQPPMLTNVDFLADYPWMQRWLQLTPEQRGVGYAPRTRWMIPR